MEVFTDTNELLEKIKVCVGYDLIGRGNNIVQYEDMNMVQQSKFRKQCNRLYGTCLNDPKDYQYINERYYDIIKQY